MQNSGIPLLLQQLFYQSPIFLACLIGIGLAVAHLSRHPAPSYMALAASCLILLTSVVIPLQAAFLYPALTASRMSTDSYSIVFAAIALINSTLRGGAFLLLMMAVYVGRKGAPAERL